MSLPAPMTYWLTTLYPLCCDGADNRCGPSLDVFAPTSLLQLNQPIKTNVG